MSHLLHRFHLVDLLCIEILCIEDSALLPIVAVLKLCLDWVPFRRSLKDHFILLFPITENRILGEYCVKY
jgi:hypothetical protein